MAPRTCIHAVLISSPCAACAAQYKDGSRAVRTVELDPPAPQYTQGQDVTVQHGVQIDMYTTPRGKAVAINVDGICALRLIVLPGKTVEVRDTEGLVTVLTNGR